MLNQTDKKWISNNWNYILNKDTYGNEHANLYFDWEKYFADTFSPACVIIQLIEFTTHGLNFRVRKHS